MPTLRHWSPIATLLLAICLLLAGAGCAKTDPALEESPATSQQELDKAHASVSWAPASLAITLAPGETRQLSVTVRALENVSATSVEIGAPLVGIVTVTPVKVPALRNGATASLTVKVSAPTSTKAQAIKGELSLRKSTDCKKNEPALCASLPVQITIKETVPQTIQRLEGAGLIPVLDRGDDLAGPDTNGNGIRDDIDAYIAKRSYTTSERKAVEQLARGFGAMIVLGHGPITENGTDDVSTQMFRAIHCIGSRMTDDGAFIALQTYRKLSVNTDLRLQAYLNYQRAREGSVSVAPQGDTCEN